MSLFVGLVLASIPAADFSFVIFVRLCESYCRWCLFVGRIMGMRRKIV